MRSVCFVNLFVQNVRKVMKTLCTVRKTIPLPPVPGEAFGRSRTTLSRQQTREIDKGNGGPVLLDTNSNCVCVNDGPFGADVAISATSLWGSLQFPEQSINSDLLFSTLLFTLFSGWDSIWYPIIWSWCTCRNTERLFWIDAFEWRRVLNASSAILLGQS